MAVWRHGGRSSPLFAQSESALNPCQSLTQGQRKKAWDHAHPFPTLPSRRASSMQPPRPRSWATARASCWCPRSWSPRASTPFASCSTTSGGGSWMPSFKVGQSEGGGRVARCRHERGSTASTGRARGIEPCAHSWGAASPNSCRQHGKACKACHSMQVQHASALAGEEFLRHSGVPYTVVRPGGLSEDSAGQAVLLAGTSYDFSMA